jgi:hypothetical protein
MLNLNENGDSPTTCTGESVYEIVGELSLPFYVLDREKQVAS